MPKNITRVKWEASGLPFGVSFNERDGTFSGAPEDIGTHVIPVTVTTNYGTDTKDVLIKIPDTSGDKITAVEGNFNVLQCVDDGNNIIFFGNQKNSRIGVFFTYNPITKETSDIFKLKDGIPIKTTDADTENTKFKAVEFDPITKKWVAFFGTHYVRTPNGIKDLGTDINLGSITSCWANNLQNICVIASDIDTSDTPLTSYLFDIDGNLINRSTQIQEIDGFNVKPNSCGGTLAWSDTIDKFAAVSMGSSNGSASNFTAISSSDGLTWTYKNIPLATCIQYIGVSSSYNTYTFTGYTVKLITLGNGNFALLSMTSYKYNKYYEKYSAIEDIDGCYVGVHISSDGINWTKNNRIYAEDAICDTFVSKTQDRIYELRVNSYLETEISNPKNKTSITYKSPASFGTYAGTYTTNPYGSGETIGKYPYFPFSFTNGQVRMIYSDTFNVIALPMLTNGFAICSL